MVDEQVFKYTDLGILHTHISLEEYLLHQKHLGYDN